MTPRRVIAAAAAVITFLVLQAVVVSPIVAPLIISLPAILVAAIGVEAGPSAGMSVGFSAGLLADLASRHPAGVLALAWLLLGAGCGACAVSQRRPVRSLLITSVAATTVTLAVAAVLAAFAAPRLPLRELATIAAPTALGTAVVAIVVGPAVRIMVRALKVRVPARGPRPTTAPMHPVALDA